MHTGFLKPNASIERTGEASSASNAGVGPARKRRLNVDVRQALLTAGINAFGADLLAESFLKSPLAKMTFDKGEPLKFFLQVQRSDCPGWVGVDITLAPVDKFDESPPNARYPSVLTDNTEPKPGQGS